MCADDTAPLCIGTHTSFAMLSPSSQPLSGLVKQWVGDRLRRGPEALLQAAARRGPEAALRAPAATTRDLPPQVPHGTEEQSNLKGSGGWEKEFARSPKLNVEFLYIAHAAGPRGRQDHMAPHATMTSHARRSKPAWDPINSPPTQGWCEAKHILWDAQPGAGPTFTYATPINIGLSHVYLSDGDATCKPWPPACLTTNHTLTRLTSRGLRAEPQRLMRRTINPGHKGQLRPRCTSG